MFSADCRLEVPLLMQFSNNTLSLKAGGIGGSFVIDQSFVGQILDKHLQEYINETLIEQELLPTIHEQIEKHVISCHLPVAKDLGLDSAKIIIFYDMIRLQADLCDPFGSTCGAAFTNEWVGNIQIPRLQINDIIPTTQAPKSTTKKNNKHWSGGTVSPSAVDYLVVFNIDVSVMFHNNKQITV
ncbi:hypothetical protein DPMN_172130 [Dreissena polymorpha]|uniref:Uncharacterized protein n=1 Tax=Dreissena polymorpha TaxID=45954 RepID=A0A9D4E2D3_DREPO|nr:hypothetical protein DPMN_172130 [Dreissena polymorpha]